MSKKIFVTLFEKIQNVHLTKDVGQVAYFMSKKSAFIAKIIGHKTDKEYPYLQSEVNGLNLILLPKLKIGRISLSLFFYLLINAKKIDVLHLFHHATKTYLYILMYKFLNNKGVVYLKSDVVLEGLYKYHSFINPRYKIRNYFFQKAIPMTDVISVETQQAYQLVNTYYPKLKEKFLYIPNGIDTESAYLKTPLQSYSQKENLIITAGRIGAYEKNNELLLEAASKVNLKDWKIIFVGPIDTKFESYITDYFIRFPHLKNTIIFTGNISSKKDLFKFYNRAKVFCLTSRSEGSPLVFPEAITYGNYILSTNVGSVEEIILGNQFGKIFTDVESLSHAIVFCIENQNLLESTYKEIIEHAKEHYDWNIIINRLENRILQCML